MGNLYIIPIEREEVENLKYARIMPMFRSLERQPDHGHNSVMITFSGYDDLVEEIFEIEAIRKWVDGLFDRCPHILYFITNVEKARENLMCTYCDIEMFYQGERLSLYGWLERLGYERFYENRPEMEIELHITDEKYKKIVQALRKFGFKVKDAYGSQETEYWLKRLFNR